MILRLILPFEVDLTFHVRNRRFAPRRTSPVYLQDQVLRHPDPVVGALGDGQQAMKADLIPVLFHIERDTRVIRSLAIDRL